MESCTEYRTPGSLVACARSQKCKILIYGPNIPLNQPRSGRIYAKLSLCTGCTHTIAWSRTVESLEHDPTRIEMGRWKPPPPKSSPYITPEGYEVLQADLKTLWTRRADVVKALAAAAAEGDRSENAEYIYRKKELGGIDYRIRYLQKRLPNLNIVRETPRSDRVHFGAWVTVERDDGSHVEYRIVGADEADAANGLISLDSPLARALLRKSPGDETELRIDDRRESLIIDRVRYE